MKTMDRVVNRLANLSVFWLVEYYVDGALNA